jgi:hypothetical protein
LSNQALVGMMWATDSDLGVSRSVGSLIDLYGESPVFFNELFGQDQSSKNPRTQRIHALYDSAAFQALWLLDGGNIEKTMSLTLWSDLLSDLCAVGAHGWFYQMPFKDTRLAFEAVAKLIAFVTDSTIALENRGLIATDFFNQQTLDSVAGFTGRGEVECEGKSNVNALVAPYFINMDTRSYLGLQVALRECVYNEALRLKSRGHATHQIVHRLDERISAIFDHVTTRHTDRPVGQIYPLFHRQVLINAFAPFPEDLAYLDASAGEMYGHLNEQAKPNERLIISDLHEDGYLTEILPVFSGPAFVTAGMMGKLSPFNIALSLEDKGVEIDLDAILTGNIHSRTFVGKVVQYKGYSKELDQIFADFADLKDKTTAKAHRVMEYAQLILTAAPYSAQAKLGYVIAHIELRRYGLKSDETLTNKFRPTSLQHLICEDEDRMKAVLGYLENTGPLDHRILQWCGFGSEVLEKLSESDQDRLAEHYLGEDLGL